MAGSVLQQLQVARKELLDLSARNRLLNTPLGRGKSTRLDVVDERSTDIFRLLVAERRELSFESGKDAATESDGTKRTAGTQATELAETDAAEATIKFNEAAEGDADDSANDEADDGAIDGAAELAQPDEEQAADQSRFTDTVLQTNLVSEQLQKRLLRLSVEAKTFEEEQGINCLFLALGFLEWYEDPKSDKPRFAPLVLIPVQLHRKSANAKFKVKALEEDIATNLSLQEKLRSEFQLKLPDLPEAEDIDIAAYFEQVEHIIADQPRWRVQRDRMTLWFFSFAKFLMFRDLMPEAWPRDKSSKNERSCRVCSAKVFVMIRPSSTTANRSIRSFRRAR